MPKIKLSITKQDLNRMPPFHGGDCEEPVKTWGKVARVVGEIGLKAMNRDRAEEGRPDLWPGQQEWEDLGNSSRWSCVRRGLKIITQGYLGE